MSDLTFEQGKKLEILLKMEGGNVADLEDGEFGSLFAGHGIRLEPYVFDEESTKADMLKTFWILETNQKVKKVIRSLLKYTINKLDHFIIVNRHEHGINIESEKYRKTEIEKLLNDLENILPDQAGSSPLKQKKHRPTYATALKEIAQAFAIKAWEKDPNLNASDILRKEAVKKMHSCIAGEFGKEQMKVETLRKWVTEVDTRPSVKKPGRKKRKN